MSKPRGGSNALNVMSFDDIFCRTMFAALMWACIIVIPAFQLILKRHATYKIRITSSDKTEKQGYSFERRKFYLSNLRRALLLSHQEEQTGLKPQMTFWKFGNSLSLALIIYLLWAWGTLHKRHILFQCKMLRLEIPCCFHRNFKTRKK